MSLEEQLARAIAVLQAQKKPKRYIVVTKPKRPAGGKRKSVGPRGGVTEVQSYLFPRSLWTEARAGAWLEQHGHASNALDVTDKYLRFRQAPPSQFKRMRTKCLKQRRGSCQIKAIIGVRR